ncbi:MAG TPA: hypothetical protein VEJ44_04370 [Acidimicrobiales bacterium]|nr:hypothetical protein [Acidimicrobiales bacterium]
MPFGGDINDDEVVGWCKDPFGVHELRWISQGTPTSLVRDGQREATDPLPAGQVPVLPLVPVETTFGSSDPRRAGQSPGALMGPDDDFGTIAMDANAIYGSSGTDNAIAPSDGSPLSGWPTAFEVKMRKRARKQRRAERWRRWFGRGSYPESHPPGSR